MDKNKSHSSLTFNQAIEMGEYKPEFLSKYEEWEGLSSYSQLQYIKEAIDNRKKRLTMQMADLYNVLDFALKPELKTAIANIHDHLSQIERDRERYYIEYTGKL